MVLGIVDPRQSDCYSTVTIFASLPADPPVSFYSGTLASAFYSGGLASFFEGNDRLGPGERMPPASDLAAVLGVTPIRCFELYGSSATKVWLSSGEDAGSSFAERHPKSAVIAGARDLVQVSLRQGYRRDELIQIIEASMTLAARALSDITLIRRR